MYALFVSCVRACVCVCVCVCAHTFCVTRSQAVGKVAVDVRDLGVDYFTVAGHKMYAPKGTHSAASYFFH